MKLRKKVLIILSVLMGVVWVVLLWAQVRLTNRVFYKEKQLFRAKVDVAATNALTHMETSPIIYIDSLQTLQHLDFETYYPFLNLPHDLSDLVNARLDLITETKPCLNSRLIDTLLIDSVFTQALHEQRIFESFVWGVYCTKESKFVYVSDKADTTLLRTAGFDYPLLAYCYPDSFHNDVLYILFPTLEQHYSWDMLVGIVLLFVLLAAILICFITIIILIIRQTKSNKMRANIMNHIIHEFKTPITTISLATQLLQDESVKKDPEATKSYLNMVDAEAQSLQTLVEEVLTVFRAEQLPPRKLQSVSLHALLQDVVKVHQLVLKEHKAEVHFNLQAESDTVMADRIHLMNAFSNLIDNAIKYCDGHLILTISTQNVDKSVEIRFKDNGIGISKENQSMIFEPFARVNVDNAKYVKGYGLGLSYVRYVVRYHGGKIKVESELGKGATFIVSLPTKF